MAGVDTSAIPITIGTIQPPRRKIKKHPELKALFNIEEENFISLSGTQIIHRFRLRGQR